MPGSYSVSDSNCVPSPRIRRAMRPVWASRRKVCSSFERTGERSGQMRTSVSSSTRLVCRAPSPSGPLQRSHARVTGAVPRRSGCASKPPLCAPVSGSASRRILARPPGASRGSNSSAASGLLTNRRVKRAWTSSGVGWPTSVSGGTITCHSRTPPAISASSTISATIATAATGAITHRAGEIAETTSATGAKAAISHAARSVGTRGSENAIGS